MESYDPPCRVWLLVLGLALGILGWLPGPVVAAGPVITGDEIRTRIPDDVLKGLESRFDRALRQDLGHDPSARRPLESDNWTFRPTVVVRRGTSQGSGTVIASVDGDTLVLTAAHVVRGRGPIAIELHRYNLGLERNETSPGVWPRPVACELVAADPSADIAVVRVRKMVALPFVARLAAVEVEPAIDGIHTSVGIDLGTKLSSWTTRLMDVLWFHLNDADAECPFLITSKIPEHGRSGGGLFDRRGELAGVCVGHAELVKGRRMGVFSSVENVHVLLRKNNLRTIVDRSEARRARLARSSKPTPPRVSRRPSSNIKATEANGEVTDQR